MNLNIKSTNFSLTPSIQAYVEKKIDSLKKFLPYGSSTTVDVEIGKTSQHHNKGDIFKAEINLVIPGKLIRAVAEEWDLMVAIDRARDELQEKITSSKEKNISLYKRSARMLKKLLKGE